MRAMCMQYARDGCTMVVTKAKEADVAIEQIDDRERKREVETKETTLSVEWATKNG